MTDGLNASPGVKCLLAGGAFYAFADVRAAIRKIHAKGLTGDTSDIAFSEFLLEKAGVAVVPGSAFGAEGYIRLSFATSMANLKNAMERMHKWLA